MATDTQIFTTIFQELNFGYVEWIIPLALLGLFTLIITRNLNDAKIIMFPLAILMQASGIPMGIITLMTTGFLFAVETFSFEMISNMINSVTRATSQASTLGFQKWRNTDKQKLKISEKAKKFERKEKLNLLEKGLIQPSEQEQIKTPFNPLTGNLIKEAIKKVKETKKGTIFRKTMTFADGNQVSEEYLEPKVR